MGEHAPAGASWSMIVPAAAQRQLFRSVNRVLQPFARTAWSGPLPIGAGLVVLETTGRRSGAPRSLPLVSVRVGRNLVSGTVRSSSDWVANLRATESPRLWVDGAPRPATATVTKLPIGSIAQFELAPRP